MLDLEKVRILGNVIDDSFNFGKASSRHGQESISCSLQGDVLTLKFVEIVHFASERSLQDQTRLLASESMEKITNRLDLIKKQFKENGGGTLRFEELSNRDDIELISATSNSPRKIAYYRRNIAVKLDA